MNERYDVLFENERVMKSISSIEKYCLLSKLARLAVQPERRETIMTARIDCKKLTRNIALMASISLSSCGDEKIDISSLSANLYLPELGAGVNYSETQTFGSCVHGVELSANPQALSRLYNESQIKSRSELHTTLDVSASVSAKGLWGNGGGSFSYFKDIDVKKDNFYWLVDANYVVTEEKIRTNSPSFSLTDKAKNILNNHGINAFYRACGTHFYVGRQLGGRYSLLYEFSSTEDKVVEQLKAKSDYSGFGVKAKASFERLLSLAHKSSILTIHSRIVGGSNRIEDYASNPDELTTELAKLREDIFKYKHGVTLKWFQQSYDMFPEVIAAGERDQHQDLEDHYREDALNFYYTLYSSNREKYASLNKLLQDSLLSEPRFIFKDKQLKQLRLDIKSLQKQNNEISLLAKSCIQGTNRCPLGELDTIHIDIPKPYRDLSGMGQWLVYPVAKGHSNASAVDFIAATVDGSTSRYFSSNYSIFDRGKLGAFVMMKKMNGQIEAFDVGFLSPVIDPNTGLTHPGICIGNFSKKCNFRMVENILATDHNDIASSKLVLTIFDEFGFVLGHLEYLGRKI